MENSLTITASDGFRYNVRVGTPVADFLAEAWQPSWRTAVLIGDANTDRLFGDETAAALRPLAERVLRLSFPAGEEHKTRRTKERLEDAMLEARVGRGGCVVALGGGIPLDVAGFVAATFLRGVAHLNVATTLLAMVDAAVGGKTGVNTAHGKNLVGAFHHPRAVLLATPWLASLPSGELRNGLAEAVKHGVVADEGLFAELERMAETGATRPTDPVIGRCVAVKAAVVAEDARETGRRAVLNFGHTVAHAVEKATGHAVGHGAAVAFGMLAESLVAGRRCGFPARDGERLRSLLARLGFSLRPPCAFAAAAPYLSADKKNRGGDLRCALPSALGRMAGAESGWTLPVSPAELQAAFEELAAGGAPCSA